MASFSCAFLCSQGTLFKRECTFSPRVSVQICWMSGFLHFLSVPMFAYPQATPSSFALLPYSSGSTSVRPVFGNTPSSSHYSRSLPFPDNLRPAHQCPVPSWQDPYGCPHLTLGCRMMSSEYTCWLHSLILNLHQ